ncbi:LEAF RUST 10 DISEASE-RESISTANCE LOCUS RECEPTOR-LIKE PROTEIN KINASE-like 2.1 [Oryza glaberrima]|uniref:Protein kinase domain-containing protein n=2 Tax=Oryza TaxID=4527 RepID=A0A0D3GAH6_9ORYZ|nr:LEAF RUST 10 DISEASE-RESISTANCE LOCUS RECEPTOR-LIKE PROTEIN KINASE-like 2.1 [Oryza glaberrima]
MRRYGRALLGSHASHLLLLLLLFWFIASDPEGATAGGGTYDAAICASPIFCGDHVEIKYPFYLSNTTDQVVVVDGNTSYCGYPWLGIICDHDRAILRLGNYNYTVLEINHGNHTVTVADSDALDGGDCPRVKHNVTLPPVLTFPSPSNDSVTFFFDCYPAADVVLRPPPYIRPINCSSFVDFQLGPSFVAAQPDVDVREERGWLGVCKEVVVAPVLKDWLENDYGVLGGDGYGAVLKRGFQLSWDPTAGMCHGCEVSGGRCSYDGNTTFLGCLCSDGHVSKTDCGSKISKKKAIAIGVSVVSGVILLFLLLMCTLCVKKFWHGLLSSMGKSKEAPNIESFLQKHEAQHPKRYSYSEVKTMTKSFSHKLGQGGFGTVYMGKMPNGKPIAVKLLKSCKDDGQEFMNEVASISRTSHVNVVTLLGYCIQGSKRALIYEFMPNGSLERFAFRPNSETEDSLSWEKLFDIAIGIARGLEYLHRGCNTRIVHFDIKPHNILLDQDFCPKISDFGLAKLCKQKESIISIDGARGTIGYIAPEVFSKQFGDASSKSDVYSYGMMILEMVGARKNISASADVSSKYFPQWIYEHLEGYCVTANEIRLDTSVLVRKMIIIGLWCIQLLPNNRPSMTRVVEMLQSSADDLQIPPQSFLC